MFSDLSMFISMYKIGETLLFILDEKWAEPKFLDLKKYHLKFSLKKK